MPLGTAGSRHRTLSIGLFSLVLFSKEITSFFSFLFPHGWQNGHLATIVNKSAPPFCPRASHEGLSLSPSRYPPLNKSLWQWRGGMQWEKRNWCWLTSYIAKDPKSQGWQGQGVLQRKLGGLSPHQGEECQAGKHNWC